MAKKYGLPYQGSKSKLAERIVALLPPATHLYDVFAGGCAVTHAALLSGKFKEVHANDITDSVKLFENALNGDLDKYEPERFRTREDFFAEKDSNPFVRIVYSFGNDQHSYLYSREMVKLGLIEYKSGDRRYDCESQERIGIITSSQSTENTPPEIRVNSAHDKRSTDYSRLQSEERSEQIRQIKK